MKFEITPNLKIDIDHIGQSREPVLIIDDFLRNPAALVNAAKASPDWKDLPPGGYPGQRAALPGDYVRAVLRRLDAPIRAKLLQPLTKLDRFDCAFSMVTRAPADLAHLQRIPHIDIAAENRIAILHYLCDEKFGGTAFFRQDTTELEQIGPKEKSSYLKARARDIDALSDTDIYPSATTPGYTQTGQTKARFNRLVAYRSFTLHSGIIDAPDLLSSDPQKGRLTANFFVDYSLLS